MTSRKFLDQANIDSKVSTMQCPARVISFYLPQYHTIPENDEWWGAGFTDWNNVRAAKPQFEGHQQPHEPSELGHYDLLDPGVQARQVELAKRYGIAGFCFYFYWFGGKRLLEAPVANYLRNAALDLPFCLCWANENWTRRWDGLEDDVLIAQQHSPADDIAFIAHVATYMRDPRYLRVDGKPLLLIYRPDLLPSCHATAQRWRAWCHANGIGDIMLACTQSFDFVPPESRGLDAAVEFPPNFWPGLTNLRPPGTGGFTGNIYDWTTLLERSERYDTPGDAVFRTVCPGWDNTARRKAGGNVFINNTPALFQRWVENAVRDTRRRIADPDRRLVFVNAWNEWAEGAHLEPDRRHGRAWLESIRNALIAQSWEETQDLRVERQTSIASRNTRLSTLELEVSGLRGDTETLESSLDGQSRKIADLAADLAGSRHRIGELKHDLAAAQTLITQQGVAIDGFSNRIETLLRDQAGLVADLDRLAMQGAGRRKLAARVAGLTSALGAPIRLVRDLVAGLRWRLHRCNPQPMHQVVPCGEASYRATGTDPQFSLSVPQGGFPSGWCRVRLRGGTEHGGLNPMLYLDLGKGFSEAATIAIPFVNALATTDHWVSLPPNVRAIRFDPFDHAGEFTLDTLEFVFAGRVARMAVLLWPFAHRALREPAWGLRMTGVCVRILRQSGLNGLCGQLALRAARDGTEYTQWTALYDTLDDKRREIMLGRLATWPGYPIISVIMPVFNPPAGFLDAAILSVRRQIYPHWELCISDDASTDAAVRKVLERHAAEDQRIRIVFRGENGHISEASNSALALASGDHVALLDHDDILVDHALLLVARAILDHPDAGLIYSDEDKIDANGLRHAPYFKSDWNTLMLRSHNMICHLAVLQTALVNEVGGFRKGFEGAQDYDLILRCVERLRDDQILHIPRILYHWRVLPGSTALATSEKPYAVQAGEAALREHLNRSGVAATVEALPYGHYRLRYAMPSDIPLVSVIIPTRNGLSLVRQCIESIRARTTYRRFEILLVDNGSDDPAALAYFQALVDQPHTRVLRDERPFNYPALNNAAVAAARGDYICLLNNDIEVLTPEWLDEMVALATQPGVGAVGARLWYPNGTLQHAGVILGLGGVAGHSHKHLPRGLHGYGARAVSTQYLSAVTAACLLVRKAAYLEVGGLDETNLPVAFNDVDFCLKLLERGYRNAWTPYAELVHHESATRGYEDTPEKQARFSGEIEYMHRRWGKQLQNDPAYNPNLTLAREDFSLAWPPRLNDIALV